VNLDLIFSPTEKFLLVLDEQNESKNYLIETETGAIRAEIKGRLWSHFFSAKDELFVFATELGTSLLDVQAGKPIQEIIQHRNTWPIALAPSGRHILVWQEGKGILWDIPAGKPGSVSFEDGKFIAGIFSPDSKKMAVMLKTEDKEKLEVPFWDPLAGKPLGKSIRVSSSFAEPFFSPDSKLLLLKGVKEDKRLLLALDAHGIRWQKDHGWDDNDNWFMVGSFCS